MNDQQTRQPTVVQTFFYGSFINCDVLSEVGIRLRQHDVVRLDGFDILIKPLANLIPSDQHCVYGIVTDITHTELSRLYDYADRTLGGRYLPYPVHVTDHLGKTTAALCYIAPNMATATPTADYVDRIVTPARHFGFPNWYVERLASFRPAVAPRAE